MEFLLGDETICNAGGLNLLEEETNSLQGGYFNPSLLGTRSKGKPRPHRKLTPMNQRKN